ncbi:peptidoglycan-binding protein [Bacillus pinisoli]|uniref:C40 family peptidase n=1 Tax=Bacillus pinisoli TaxID=2901866 RepID=UPI001FF11F26|nr:peptidoglycan-binding protein [Bacillus pinisoli]
MNKRNGVGGALVLSTMAAAGFVLLGPEKASAAEGPPLLSNNEVEKTNQTLRYGHKGLSVKALQLELKALQFYTDKVDGIYGPATQAAIKEFQFVHHIKVDGVAGPTTLRRLYFSKEAKTYQQFTASKLLEGDQGTQVIQVQEKLKKLGYYAYTVDGVFGPLTKDAITRYQQKNGFKTDGVAGPDTLKHLFANQNVLGKTIVSKKLKVEGKKIVTKKVKNETAHSVDASIMGMATQLVGTPYKWGGTSPNGFDCSGFLQYVFAKKGVNIPRTVSDIWNFAVTVGKPSVGDVVFFQTYKKGPSHAGIYLGDGKFIHSGSKGVTISKMSSSYWAQRYLGSKRVVQYN